MKKFLQRGNIFKIEKGMQVYTEIPAKYLYKNLRNSNRKTYEIITVGEVFSLSAVTKTADMIELRDDIKKDFLAHGLCVSEEKINSFLKSLNISLKEEMFNTSIFCGEYIVTKTKFSKQNGKRGWHVTASKLKNGEYNPNGLSISFYQSGPYIPMLVPKEITLIGDVLECK